MLFPMTVGSLRLIVVLFLGELSFASWSCFPWNCLGHYALPMRPSHSQWLPALGESIKSSPPLSPGRTPLWCHSDSRAPCGIKLRLDLSWNDIFHGFFCAILLPSALYSWEHFFNQSLAQKSPFQILFLEKHMPLTKWAGSDRVLEGSSMWILKFPRIMTGVKLARKIVIWVSNSLRMRLRGLRFKMGFYLLHICTEKRNVLENKTITMLTICTLS